MVELARAAPGLRKQARPVDISGSPITKHRAVHAVIGERVGERTRAFRLAYPLVHPVVAEAIRFSGSALLVPAAIHIHVRILPFSLFLDLLLPIDNL